METSLIQYFYKEYLKNYPNEIVDDKKTLDILAKPLIKKQQF